MSIKTAEAKQIVIRNYKAFVYRARPMAVAFAALTGTVLCSASCYFQEGLNLNDYVLIHYSNFPGARYRSAISKDTYETLPDWNPNEGGHPPLTPKIAIDLAQSQVDATLDDSSRFEWQFVSLNLQPIGGSDPKWMYMVVFESRNNEGIGPSKSAKFECIVTLDGKAIKPVLVNDQ